MTWATPLQCRDAYDILTRRLNYPSSQTLRRILETAMSLEQAELLVELPGTVDELAEKLKRDPQVVTDQMERLFWAGLVYEMENTDGSVSYKVPTPYCIELVSDNMMYAIGGNYAPKSGKTTAQDLWGVDKKSDEICGLWNKFFYEEWYRWGRVDELVHRRVAILGGSEGLARGFGMMPATIALEKSEPFGLEILPGWDLREIARAGEKGMYCRACTCRTRARGCDFPLWTCNAIFDGMPGRDGTTEIRTDRRGQLHKYSGEEWLELMIVGEEDQMMVHMGDAWNVYCSCCRDCCNYLNPLRMYSNTPWEGVHPSPYRAVVDSTVCEGCTTDCVPRCAFNVITLEKNVSTGKSYPHIDPDKCVGCGQCVVGCRVQGALVMKLAEDAGAHIPVMGGRAKVPEGIRSFNPDIKR